MLIVHLYSRSLSVRVLLFFCLAGQNATHDKGSPMSVHPDSTRVGIQDGNTGSRKIMAAAMEEVIPHF